MAFVTLLSDFGTSDGFVASMKGVVLQIAPSASVVDTAHDIAPGDVEAGAWVLAQYWKLFPRGTVHVAVVDPGVGSARRPIAVQADERFVVAPDNGLIDRVLAGAEAWRCVELTEKRYLRSAISGTFHGRDIFAPAAAHLAVGERLERFGSPVSEPVRLDLQPPSRLRSGARGRVAHIDRFGNLITDIPAAWTESGWRFEVANIDVGPLRGSYSEVARGELVAVIGSMGTVEIAARESSASEQLGARRGDPVVARRSE